MNDSEMVAKIDLKKPYCVACKDKVRVNIKMMKSVKEKEHNRTVFGDIGHCCRAEAKE